MQIHLSECYISTTVSPTIYLCITNTCSHIIFKFQNFSILVITSILNSVWWIHDSLKKVVIDKPQ